MMKILFSFIFTICITVVHAQISEQSASMVHGSQNALVVDFPDASPKFIDSKWREFMRKHGRAKKVKKSKELLVNARILKIGGVNSVGIYARSESASSGARLFTWFDNDGTYVSSSDGDAYQGATELLEDFRHKIKVDLIAIDLDDQEKALGKLENKLKKLVRDNEGFHRDIEVAQEKIRKAEENIVKNNEDQELTNQDIAAQKGVVDQVRERLNQVRSERPGGS